MRHTTVLLASIAVIAAMPGIATAQTDEPVPNPERSTTDRSVDGLHDRDLDSVKERLLAQIERRIEALDRMSAAVEANEHVTKEHAKDLEDDYKDAKKILEDVAKDVEKAESLEELREIVPEVFAETLVFALLRPKTHLVVGSDSIVAITNRLGGLTDHLQEVITRLEEAGKDMAAAQAALNEMKAAISSAASTASPVAGNVIGLDPADWPEPAQSTLVQGRSDLADARGLLRSAHELRLAIVALIREAMSTD